MKGDIYCGRICLCLQTFGRAKLSVTLRLAMLTCSAFKLPKAFRTLHSLSFC